MSDFQIGCHLSASKGFLNMGQTALSIGANTFQFFTRNPRGNRAKAFDDKDALAFVELAVGNGIETVLAHAPYTLNPCAAEERIREFTEQTFVDDLSRMERLASIQTSAGKGLTHVLYNFHPGSHVGQGAERGMELISSMLNQVLLPNSRTTVLLETMAGKGSEVGRRFEELKHIIDGVRYDLRPSLGVCLDTCHVYDGGYDIVGHLDDVLDEFDATIGLHRLRAIHLNDSKNPFESHKDRHELIGEGSIGLQAFEAIINHPSLRRCPFFLETPNELPGYAREIALLTSLRRS